MSNSQKKHQQASNSSSNNKKLAKPMIVDRVNKFPIVSMAVSMGFSQYDKLKSSNVTVGDVMTRAESWAAYVWEKVQPIVEKLQEPLHKADQLACTTLDFVESHLQSMPVPHSLVTKYTGKVMPHLANGNANNSATQAAGQ